MGQEHTSSCTRNRSFSILQSYGCGPSPFVLNGTLKHHLSKYEEDDPHFVQKMKNSLYIDDLASGGNSAKEAYNIYLKARARMMHGGFEMHKWKSNSSKLTRLITTPNECESQKSRSEDKDDVTYAKAALGEIQSDCETGCDKTKYTQHIG